MSDKTRVSFPYKGETLTGTVIRLNRKTVTVETETFTFRVPYSILTPKLEPPKPKAKKQTGKKPREWSKTQAADYQKSLSTIINPITTKKLTSLHIAVKMLSDALKNGEENAINEFTNEMIAELNLIYKLPHLKVFTGGKRRMTRSGGQYYGVYRTRGSQETRHSISVYSRTAKTQKYVAPKTFLRTLIHEWGHHYDKHKLKLNSTFHTKGFYDRMNIIYNQLKEPLNN